MTGVSGPADLRELAARFLAEDVGRGDRTTEAVIPADLEGGAVIEARQVAVIAGLPLVEACFDVAGAGDLAVVRGIGEGDNVASGEAIVTIEGLLAPILTAERTALNILARLSGIATLTARFVRAIEGTGAALLDTRKTTPGWRALEKYAVRTGGGTNHRSGLDDGILIKDNHVAAAGGVADAVKRAQSAAPIGLRIEVEVTDFDELDEALGAGADMILLDNMTPDLVARAVERTKGRALLECSGGITIDNVRSYAETGVEYISVGALTHSAMPIDLSLEVT